MSESLLYFDHHATTPLDPRVLEVMSRIYRDFPGNAASTSHLAGTRARQVVDESREQIATLLGFQPREVIFTSGATEANNLAIKGLFPFGTSPAHMITNAAEHRAVLDPARRLRRWGHQVTILNVDRNGRVSAEAIRDAITEKTRLVSVMLANNEIGTINNLRPIAEACRENGVILHTDAAQAVGKIPINANSLGVDLLSFTAHKVYGPVGIGALCVRQTDPAIPLQPLFDGGGHEQGLRSGTLPVPLIAGFAEALKLAVAEMDLEQHRLTTQRDRLWQKLQNRIPGISRNGDPTVCLAGNLNITIPGVHGDALLAALQKSRLCVSSGSACTSANPEPSHVLKAIGLSDRDARASLRFGLGRHTTDVEIDEASQVLGDVLEAIRTA